VIDAYWNRRKGLYSLRQNGRVVGHAPRIMLRDVKLIVKPGALARIRATGQREVCAWARGRLVEVQPEWGGEEPLLFDPFEHDAFVDMWDEPIDECRVLHMMKLTSGSPWMSMEW
jgi:hypothetical protein